MYELRDGTKVDSLDTDVILSTDPRNQDYLIGPVAAKKLQNRWWKTREKFDQGRTGRCVSHAIAHERETQPLQCDATKRHIVEMHRLAQNIDPYSNDGPQYGTDVNSVCKIIRGWGWIGGWKWMKDADDVFWNVSYRGPVVIVVDMPGPTGLHAMLATLISLNDNTIQGPNSWGKQGSTFKFTFAQFRKIFKQGVIFHGRKC